MWRLVHRFYVHPINSFRPRVISCRQFATEPKLTLFSGPRCSLCDDAKLLLNDLKKERPFQLETVDIHAQGQEKWKRRYVYTIPVLHLDGKVIAQGRWNEGEIRNAIIEWDETEKDPKDQPVS